MTRPRRRRRRHGAPGELLTSTYRPHLRRRACGRPPVIGRWRAPPSPPPAPSSAAPPQRTQHSRTLAVTTSQPKPDTIAVACDACRRPNVCSVPRAPVPDPCAHLYACRGPPSPNRGHFVLRFVPLGPFHGRLVPPQPLAVGCAAPVLSRPPGALAGRAPPPCTGRGEGLALGRRAAADPLAGGRAAPTPSRTRGTPRSSPAKRQAAPPARLLAPCLLRISGRISGPPAPPLPLRSLSRPHGRLLARLPPIHPPRRDA
jgi:hypothetical protein